MSHHHDKVLALLKGASQKYPMRLDDLAKRMGLSTEATEQLVVGLRNSGAVCLARITKGGQTYDVTWPSGICASRISARDFVINGKTVEQNVAASRMAAREALNRKESI